LICAKFGKDLFNISKVTGRKKVAQFFFTQSVHCWELGIFEEWKITGDKRLGCRKWTARCSVKMNTLWQHHKRV